MCAGRVQVSLIAEAVLWKRGFLVMPPIVGKLLQAMQVCSLSSPRASSVWQADCKSTCASCFLASIFPMFRSSRVCWLMHGCSRPCHMLGVVLLLQVTTAAHGRDLWGLTCSMLEIVQLMVYVVWRLCSNMRALCIPHCHRQHQMRSTHSNIVESGAGCT